MIVWIASYPKSGNTFLRILLAEYLYGDFSTRYNFSSLSKIEMFPNLFKLLKLHEQGVINHIQELKSVKFLHKYSLYLQNKLFLNGTHFLKTHSINFNINDYQFTNSSITSCAIYLVRDPRNVLYSYSDFSNQSVEKTADDMKSEIITQQFYNNEWYPTCHIGSWRSNYLSWIKSQMYFPVKIIKFEDLVTKPREVFFDVLVFLNQYAGVAIDIQRLNSTIERAEFNSLKQLEDQGLFKEASVVNKNNKFFNLGKNRDWKNIQNFEQYLNQINAEFKNEMELLGY